MKWVAQAHVTGQAEEEVRHRFAVVADIAAGSQRAAGAGQEDRKVGVRMTIAVGIATTIDDHGVFQQRTTVFITHSAQLFEQSRELLSVPPVDVGHLGDAFGAIAVMRQVVMAFGDADLIKKERLLPSWAWQKVITRV